MGRSRKPHLYMLYAFSKIPTEGIIFGIVVGLEKRGARGKDNKRESKSTAKEIEEKFGKGREVGYHSHQS